MNKKQNSYCVAMTMACRWENFLKKNKISCVLIREFRVWTLSDYKKSPSPRLRLKDFDWTCEKVGGQTHPDRYYCACTRCTLSVYPITYPRPLGNMNRWDIYVTEREFYIEVSSHKLLYRGMPQYLDFDHWKSNIVNWVNSFTYVNR